MRIKMADVARELGVSKATVSLAVNGKPGVSDKTRAMILEYIDSAERGKLYPSGSKQDMAPVEKKIIKVLIVNRCEHVVYDPEMDLWTDSMAAYDHEIRACGCIGSFSYIDDDTWEQMIEECNMDSVAGVIIHGTEMKEADFSLCERIHKPIVLYDCEVPGITCHSICLDNQGIVESACAQLRARGASRIVYAGTGKEIYNFIERRKAFQDILIRQDFAPRKSDMICLGNTIVEITENASKWLESNPLPDAFIFENFQISTGMITALQRNGIHSQNRLGMIGIDEVPAYMVAGIPFTRIRIPHAERAKMSVQLLNADMEGKLPYKVKLRMGGHFIPVQPPKADAP